MQPAQLRRDRADARGRRVARTEPSADDRRGARGGGGALRRLPQRRHVALAARA